MNENELIFDEFEQIKSKFKKQKKNILPATLLFNFLFLFADDDDIN